jgi:hypothetical protein
MQKTKLRVGLLLDGTEIAAWAYRMVEIVRQGDFAEISLVVQCGAAGKKPPALAGRATGLGILTAWERFLVGKPGELPDAFERSDIGNLTAGIEVIVVSPQRPQSPECIEEDELARIRARNIDVLIDLESRALRGGILRSARHGVWSCRIGGDGNEPAEDAGYREVMESQPVIESRVRILNGNSGGGWDICRSFSATHDMSLADNRSNAQWKALHDIPRKLRELYERGAGEFFGRVREEGVRVPSSDERAPEMLSNGERAVLLWKKLLKKIGRKWNDTFYFRQWFLLYDLQEGMSTSFGRFRRIVPPKDRFWADPFIVARDGKYYIFIEEMLYARRKGHISVIVMDRSGGWEPPVCVLQAPWHLSYPFVFEFEGELYMTPESRGSRTIGLYKCTGFPYEWKLESNVMEDCRAVDPTLFQWQGRWWLFVNQAESEGASLSEELFLYHSDSPLSGRWTPHPRNPVVSDARSSRPAGRLFVLDGRLYRPSQNCCPHYGYGFNICEITKLTETGYEERIVSRVAPGWDRNVVSTHTLNYEDRLTVIDGQLYRRR